MNNDQNTIHILFLGTGAADWPVPYAPSGNEAQNGLIRGFTSVLIDHHILIDCGVTVPDAIQYFGADPNAITDILITHAHRDHFDADTIKRLASQRHAGSPVNLWSHPTTLAQLPEIEGISLHPVQIGETFDVSDLAVTALAANHECGDATALHYLLGKSGVSVLYATDGAWFLKSTWTQLRETTLDALIWDATNGETHGNWRIFEHNSVDMINIMRQTLVEEGVVSPHTKVFLTHLARTLCAPHADMMQTLVPQGLIPTHDGLEVSISSGVTIHY